MGKGRAILQLIQRMEFAGVKPDKSTLITIINACTSSGSLAEARIVHKMVSKSEYKSDIGLRIWVAKMYCSCNSPEDALSLFDPVSKGSVGLWTALIGFYAQKGDAQKAFHLFGQMQDEGVEPDKASFVTLLSASSSLVQGKKVHEGIIRHGFDADVVVATALIKMYGHLGSIDEARNVFEGMQVRNVISWTSMIAAYIKDGDHKAALRLFREMQNEGLAADKVAYITVLDAFCGPASLAEGRLVHRAIVDQGWDSDVILGTALISMYGRCGSVTEARWLFDGMPEHNVICCTAMMTVYAQQGDGLSALQIFDKMLQIGMQPTVVTWISVIDACALSLNLEKGRLAHAHIIKHGFEHNVAIGTALINMYGKCGCLNDAVGVFDKMFWRNVLTWNSIMAIYARHGSGVKTMQLFGLMQWMGFRPNNVTFLNILYSCIHAGLIDQGCDFFLSLKDNDATVLEVEHYGCMIDLLVRADRMDVAENLVMNSPFRDNDILWMTLLAARKSHRQAIELAISK